jgi:hypothetical protein
MPVTGLVGWVADWLRAELDAVRFDHALGRSLSCSWSAGRYTRAPTRSFSLRRFAGISLFAPAHRERHQQPADPVSLELELDGHA